MTATATMSDSSTTTWNAQFAALKARFPHVRDAILVAFHILTRDPNISTDDAKAQAKLLGTKITAASVSAAQRLLSRQGDSPAAATKPVAGAPQRRARRAKPTEVRFDAESLVRGVVAKIQGQGSVEAQRLREALRKAIAVLQAAVGT